MVIQIGIYPAWFKIEESVDICACISARIILPEKWLTTKQVLKLPLLPDDFDLFTYANKNRIHVIFFRPPDKNYNDERIHPDLILTIIKRRAKKLCREDGITNLREYWLAEKRQRSIRRR